MILFFWCFGLEFSRLVCWCLLLGLCCLGLLELGFRLVVVVGWCLLLVFFLVVEWLGCLVFWCCFGLLGLGAEV